MKAIGIRELKNRTSRYIAEVRAGEIFFVTDRGHVVAELRPPGALAPAHISAGLSRMIDRGEIVAGLPHDPKLYQRLGSCAPAGTAQSLLDEERG